MAHPGGAHDIRHDVRDTHDEMLKFGHYLLSLRDVAEAAGVFEVAARAFPTSAEVLVAVATARLALGEANSAEVAAQRAIFLSPWLPSARVALAQAQRRRGAGVEALHALTYAAHLFPPTRELFVALVEMLLAEGHYAVALEESERWLAAFPTDARAVVAAGQALLNLGGLDQAERFATVAVTLEPTSASALELRISVAMAKADSQALTEWTKRAATLLAPPHSGRIVARAEEIQGRVASAMRILEEQVRCTDDKPTLETLLRLRSAHAAEPDAQAAVFVTSGYGPRMHRLAAALKSRGWRVHLLAAKGAGHLDPAYESVREFATGQEAVSVAHGMRPRAFHLFSWGGMDPFLTPFLEHKPGKVAFESYDTPEGLPRMGAMHTHARAHRAAIERADGIVCRDLRHRFLIRELKYCAPRKRLYFPDYCSGEWLPPPVLGPDDEIHVASAGYVAVSEAPELDWGLVEIAEQLADNEVHLHVYPGVSQAGQAFETVLTQTAGNAYFHLHHSLPDDALIRALNQSHAGIMIRWQVAVGLEPGDITDFSLRTCGSARLVESLNAGTPFILPARCEFQTWRLRRFGLAIAATRAFFEHAQSNLRSFLLDPDLQGRVERARRETHIDRHIDRLIRFYESL
jgi:tetratricopeptide (TPR) repeat protein